MAQDLPLAVESQVKPQPSPYCFSAAMLYKLRPRSQIQPKHVFMLALDHSTGPQIQTCSARLPLASYLNRIVSCSWVSLIARLLLYKICHIQTNTIILTQHLTQHSIREMHCCSKRGSLYWSIMLAGNKLMSENRIPTTHTGNMSH